MNSDGSNFDSGRESGRCQDVDPDHRIGCNEVDRVISVAAAPLVEALDRDQRARANGPGSTRKSEPQIRRRLLGIDRESAGAAAPHDGFQIAFAVAVRADEGHRAKPLHRGCQSDDIGAATRCGAVDQLDPNSKALWKDRGRTKPSYPLSCSAQARKRADGLPLGEIGADLPRRRAVVRARIQEDDRERQHQQRR